MSFVSLNLTLNSRNRVRYVAFNIKIVFSETIRDVICDNCRMRLSNSIAITVRNLLSRENDNKQEREFVERYTITFFYSARYKTGNIIHIIPIVRTDCDCSVLLGNFTHALNISGVFNIVVTYFIHLLTDNWLIVVCIFCSTSV